MHITDVASVTRSTDPAYGAPRCSRQPSCTQPTTSPSPRYHPPIVLEDRYAMLGTNIAYAAP
eukprot:54636-Rhodomonas_salina.1